MAGQLHPRGRLLWAGGTAALAGVVALAGASLPVRAGFFHRDCGRCCNGCASPEGVMFDGPPDGAWYWLRSPDEERRAVMALYNRYCIRCHGVDGRGVWDIPDVPNFTNTVWQASRSDGDLARIILEGRGAVMPPFRGTLSLEEAWGMARYLRTFVPGNETSRPDTGTPAKPTSNPTTNPARSGALLQLPEAPAQADAR